MLAITFNTERKEKGIIIRRSFSDPAHTILHNPSGPAVESTDSSRQEWWFKGNRHRLDGPALVYQATTTALAKKHGSYPVYAAWFMHGVLHNDDGPAIVDYRTGRVCYYEEGLKHRDDGPAVISSGAINPLICEWWWYGLRVSRKEHHALALQHLGLEEFFDDYDGAPLGNSYQFNIPTPEEMLDRLYEKSEPVVSYATTSVAVKKPKKTASPTMRDPGAHSDHAEPSHSRRSYSREREFIDIPDCSTKPLPTPPPVLPWKDVVTEEF